MGYFYNGVLCRQNARQKSRGDAFGQTLPAFAANRPPVCIHEKSGFRSGAAHRR